MKCVEARVGLVDSGSGRGWGGGYDAVDVLAEVSLHLAAEETLEHGDDGQKDEQCEEDDDADDDEDGLVVADDERAARGGQEEGIEELAHHASVALGIAVVVCGVVARQQDGRQAGVGDEGVWGIWKRGEGVTEGGGVGREVRSPALCAVLQLLVLGVEGEVVPLVRLPLVMQSSRVVLSGRRA